MIALLLATLVAGAAPPEERLAVVVGANTGNDDEAPLRYAEDDARRFADLLVEIGDVAKDRTLLVTTGGAEKIFSALEEARGRAAEVARSGHRLVFIFYYSGHGDLDALHVRGGDLPLPKVREEIAAIDAEVKVLFIDACRTSGRAKGVHHGPAFSLAAAEAQHGSVEFQASSKGEAAQESDELGGAVFSHYITTGLRGAADENADGRVTVSELYAYAYRRTVWRTTSGTLLQHPSLTVDLSGAGEVALGFPERAAAFIDLPESADRYVIFSLPSAAVVGELSDPATLAVPAGRFLVTRRASGATGVTEVDLSLGGKRTLHGADFRPVAPEELAARGGHFDARPWRVQADVGVESLFGAAEGAGLRAGAALQYVWREWAGGLRASYLWSPLASPTFAGTANGAALGLIGQRGWFKGAWTFAVVADLEARAVWQRLSLRSPNEVSVPRFWRSASYGGFAGALGGAVSLALGGHVAIAVNLSPGFLLRNELQSGGDSRLAAHALVDASAWVSYDF